MWEENNNMEENKDKKEYKILKELNERLTNFNADDKKNIKEKDDEEER